MPFAESLERLLDDESTSDDDPDRGCCPPLTALGLPPSRFDVVPGAFSPTGVATTTFGFGKSSPNRAIDVGVEAWRMIELEVVGRRGSKASR